MAKQEYPCGIPIKYRRLHYSDGALGFWQATFLADYGPWKRGECYWHVYLDLLTMKIWAQTRNGTAYETAGELAIRIVPAADRPA